MSDVNKKQVYELYDEITHWFDSNRNKGLMEREYLEILINKIPEKGKILDLGCGSGEPIAKFLIEKEFKLYGVDGSKNMIELCKQRFPNHKWFVADMSILDLKEKFGKFHTVQKVVNSLGQINKRVFGLKPVMLAYFQQLKIFIFNKLLTGF